MHGIFIQVQKTKMTANSIGLCLHKSLFMHTHTRSATHL